MSRCAYPWAFSSCPCFSSSLSFLFPRLFDMARGGMGSAALAANGKRQPGNIASAGSLARALAHHPKAEGARATGTAPKKTIARSRKFQSLRFVSPHTMAQQRTALWEADLDEDFHDVDLNLAIGTYGQNGLYDDGTHRASQSSCAR